MNKINNTYEEATNIFDEILRSMHKSTIVSCAIHSLKLKLECEKSSELTKFYKFLFYKIYDQYCRDMAIDSSEIDRFMDTLDTQFFNEKDI